MEKDVFAVGTVTSNVQYSIGNLIFDGNKASNDSMYLVKEYQYCSNSCIVKKGGEFYITNNGLQRYSAELWRV